MCPSPPAVFYATRCDLVHAVIGIVDNDASVLLSGLSGFELQERLAEDQILIPIIFITAHDDALTQERAQKVEHSLIGAIEKALGRE